MTALILTLSPLTAFSQEYKPRLTAPNGEPYYTSKLNVYSQTGYGMPNCVAYAYGRLYELNGEAPKLNRGDAGQWWSINKRNGYYDYGDVAERGAVACWSNHVAIVEEINKDGSITVSESHWGGNYFNTKHIIICLLITDRDFTAIFTHTLQKMTKKQTASQMIMRRIHLKIRILSRRKRRLSPLLNLSRATIKL